MINEQQKYLSGLLKAVGLGFLTPFGSVVYQWLVSKKNAFESHICFIVLLSLFGGYLLFIGYNILTEKSKRNG